MNEQILQLETEFRSLITEASGLANKGAEITQDDLVRIDAIKARQAQILVTSTGMQSAIAATTAGSEFLQWAGEVRGRPDMSNGNGGGTFGNGVNVVAQVTAGETIFHEDGDIEERGFALNKEQIATIKKPEYRASFHAYLRGKGNLSLMKPDEVRTLQEGIDDQGGYLVPRDMLNQIIQKKPAPTRLAGMVTSVNTSRDALSVPKVNYTTDDKYTTGIRTTWVGEVPSSATQHRVTDPVFGQEKVDVFTNMMSCPLTKDFIEDAAVDVQSYVSGKFNETIDLLKEDMIVNGTGVNQPAGILRNVDGTGEPASVVSGDATHLTADGLIDLAFSVPEQYEDNLKWVFNKTSTGKAIRKLKDGDGRYLWAMLENSGLVTGTGARPLLEYPTTFSAFAPDIAANAYPVIFGDLRGYWNVNRVGFSIQVLNELYAETNQVVLLGRIRFGGKVVEPWKIKVQKVST